MFYWRNNIGEMAHRVFMSMSRATVRKHNDDMLWPELDLDMSFGESKRKVEWPQQYGFSAFIKGMSEQAGGAGGGASGDGGGDATGGGAQSGSQKAAEAMVLFVNGTRSHGIVLAVGDRRYRVKGIKEGEVCIYDDQKQQIHLTREGVFVSVPHDKKITTQIIKQDDQNQQQGGQQASAQQGQTGKQKDGQDPQHSKKVHSSFELSQDTFIVKHPKKIAHHITDDQGEVKHSFTMDDQGKFELKGKNFASTFEDVAWDKA